MSCTVNIRHFGEIAIVELAGRFTLSDATGVIRGAVSNVLDLGKRAIVLDLEKVTYLDSAAGIGELVSSYTTALRQGGSVKLLNPGKNIDRVLRIVGLHDVFDIFDDEQTALQSFQSQQSAAAS